MSDISYHSTANGYEVKCSNVVHDKRYGLDEHHIDGTIGDEADPFKLLVSIKDGCLMIEDAGIDGPLLDIIPLTEIHKIRFDALQGSSSTTGLSSILYKASNDMKGSRRP